MRGSVENLRRCGILTESLLKLDEFYRADLRDLLNSDIFLSLILIIQGKE
jgi:hypothetical protein